MFHLIARLVYLIRSALRSSLSNQESAVPGVRTPVPMIASQELRYFNW